MRRKTAVILGVSGAALALTASSAFTAGGVTLNSSTAATGFIGGSVEQNVSGTEIASVVYTPTAGKLTKINITFTDTNANGKRPTVAVDDGGTATAVWTCGVTASKASECTPDNTGTKPNTADITKVTFTVA